MMKPILVPLLGIAALAALSGCSLGLSGKAPPFMLTLTPAAMAPANEGNALRIADAIVVTTPIVPQAIATTRVPVADGQTAIAYVKNAVWVEPPARLFQRLLSETIRTVTGRPVVDQRQLPGIPGALLSGQLIHFGIDARKSEAVVIYDATLTREMGKRLDTRRFEARVPVSTIDAATSGTALNRAANMVATEVAAWMKG